VDLYQIHGWDPRYAVEESMETMLRLQEEGKTRYVGVSNYGAAQMAQALQVGRFHSNQVRYNLFDRQIEAQDIAFCEREGIGIVVHSPLAKGLLTGKYGSGHSFDPDDERSRFPRFQGKAFAAYLAVAEQLGQVAADKGLNLVQLAIAWTLRQRAVSCVLVGAKNPAQVRDHLGAVGVAFSVEELAHIDQILQGTPGDA
jgi:aryl-alcohol dehydrogenase-like predicted oxidoreductase